MDGTVKFNTNSLQTFDPATQTGIITETMDADNAAPKNLSSYPLAHANASTVAGDDTPNKIITLTGTLCAVTPAGLDALEDTFKSYMNGRNKNLDIGFYNGTRRWLATAMTPQITRLDNKIWATFTQQFYCSQTFGVAVAPITAVNQTGRTANAYTDSHAFQGTAEYQICLATITLTAVSATGSQSLTWGNNDNGQAITVTRNSWAAGDVVVIDCTDPTNQKVLVNGVPADFSGAFPEFTPTTHVMSYNDTFTSRTMSESVIYYPRYA
jgi:hypothetical protein